MPGAGEWRSVLRVSLIGLGCLSLAILVLFMGYFIGRSGGFYDAEAHGYSAQYRQATDDRINDCFRKARPAPDAASCVEEAINSSHEDRRSEQNLDAQRDMADWAWWLLIVTIGQTPITAIGIILLLRNIQQADAANAISREAMTAENRAWVEIEILALGTLTHENEQFRLPVKFLFRNIGKTVALNVSAFAELIPDPMRGNRKIGEIPPELLEVFARNKGRPRKLFSQNVFPDRKSPVQDYTVAVQADKVELRISEEKGTNLFPMSLIVGVQYNTIFDKPEDEPHETIEFADLRRLHKGRPSLVIVGKDPVPAAEMSLLRSPENWGVVT